MKEIRYFRDRTIDLEVEKKNRNNKSQRDVFEIFNRWHWTQKQNIKVFTKDKKYFIIDLYWMHHSRKWAQIKVVIGQDAMRDVIK